MIAVAGHPVVTVGLLDAISGLLDVVAGLLLHGGAHATESSATVETEYVAASIAFVGLVGGLLYWYYGRRVERG